MPHERGGGDEKEKGNEQGHLRRIFDSRWVNLEPTFIRKCVEKVFVIFARGNSFILRRETPLFLIQRYNDFGILRIRWIAISIEEKKRKN